ncbi:MAG TPA: hypothetical protein VN157_04525 [Caulobacter sp.]|nr:hypothetical protein [Caulobacter sp.]
MAELVYDPQHLSPGETYYRLTVGTNPSTGAILADLDMDLVAPADPDFTPAPFSGFELPARDTLFQAQAQAQARAGENGVGKILVVDPLGLLSLAPPSRYGRTGRR